MPPVAQEVLENLKDRWFQADTNPTDQLLNEQEFLSFLHPEHSKGMLRYMVKEIVRDLGESSDPKRLSGVLVQSGSSPVNTLVLPQTRTAIKS